MFWSLKISIVTISSGGPYAQAASIALFPNTDLSVRDIAERSLHIAAEKRVYTYDHLTHLALPE